MCFRKRLILFAKWSRLCWWAALAIASYQLFVPPIIGQGDTGDAWRNLRPGGLGYPHDRDYGPLVSAYAVARYRVVEPRLFNDTGSKWDTPTVSSEVLVIHVARLFNAVFEKTPFFDLRFLGLAHLLIFLAGWRLCLEVALRRLDVRAVAAASSLAVLIFTDVGYVAYFNSAYGEAAVLCFLSLTVGCALQVIDRKGLFWYAAFSLSAALFVAAKAQNSISALVLVPIALVFGAWVAARPAARLLSALLIAGAGLLVFSTGHIEVLKRSDVYSSIFTGILPNTEDPKGAMAELGLDPRLEKYIGRLFWPAPGEPAGPANDPVYEEEFASRDSFAPILRYYLRHPGVLFAVLQKGAARAFELRVPYLGNFTADSGMPPFALSRAFSLWSWFAAEKIPATLWMIVLWQGSAFVLGLVGVVRSRRAETRLTAILVLGLVGLASLAYAACLLGAGMEALARHLFIFNALGDLLLVAGAAALVDWWFSRRAWLGTAGSTSLAAGLRSGDLEEPPRGV